MENNLLFRYLDMWIKFSTVARNICRAQVRAGTEKPAFDRGLLQAKNESIANIFNVQNWDSSQQFLQKP